MMKQKIYDCIIIGAGISGILAALELKRMGLSVISLDKGKYVGGRMSTWEIGDLRFDYGAQAINSKNKDFKYIIEKWYESGLLDKTPYSKKDDNSEYFYSPNGISKLLHKLSAELNIISGFKVNSISHDKGMWDIFDENKVNFKSKVLLLTQPVPQILELVKKSQLVLDNDLMKKLNKIKYEKCLSILVEGKINKNYSENIYIESNSNSISLIINNYNKGVSKQPGALTLLSSPEFSDMKWNDSDNSIVDTVIDSLKNIIDVCEKVIKVHRWKYSKVIDTYPDPYAISKGPGLMVLAGDGFAGKDIEGASMSGIEAAKIIISKI